jgi:nicotinate-nucleotide--dimethylbenzimidazole phosphoribosyltransferase
MAKRAGVDCLAVDMGMASKPRDPRIIDRRIGPGTRDISCGPAMTRDEALRAVQVGFELVGELKGQGYQLIATGEMGIGNTTTAAAVACALSGEPPKRLVGRGAGLSDEGLLRKRVVIERALALNAPDADDALDVLTKVGGFDIAGLCGMYLGAAAHRVPIVIDGLISAVAAWCAVRLRPDCAQAMLASHLSDEHAAQVVLDGLGLVPPLRAGLRLGEGTGAVCLVPLLDMALALYEGTTFDDYGLAAYEVTPS